MPELNSAASPTVRVVPVSLSLTDPGSVNNLASKIRAEQGGCDVLINVAGVFHFDPAATKEQRTEMYDTNFYGTMRVC